MERKINLKTILKAAAYYAVIPFAASLFGFASCLTGKTKLTLLVVPLVTVLIYVLFRKKLNMKFVAEVNGGALFILTLCFTVLMVIAKGSAEGTLVSYLFFVLFPFAPVGLVLYLMEENIVLYAVAFLTYLSAFLIAAYYSKMKIQKVYIPAAIMILCTVLNGYLYLNRPAVRYAGHGFDYMHGFSSTDFTDYTVYSENSKLVTLDHPADLIIENEEDMPVLDGAEACYPLYAAYAKACYKDIDQIEKKYLDDREKMYTNGKIVSFTNTIRGIDRLIYWGEEPAKDDDAIDMFFGARPSAEQMESAKAEGVELEITPIGKEAFVFFVEEDNPVDNLTSDQLRAIYHGDITNWKEVGGKNQKIRAFQRPANSGSQTMMEYFMGDVTLKEPETFEMVSAMTGVIQQVAQYANEEGAIGYSFRYFIEGLNQEKNVKLLSIDGVYPSLDNIESSAYPQTGYVCLITRKDETNPYVEKMKEFILSEDGQYIMRQVGYAGL